ncbi:MAG: hypothetical protein IPJ09_03180 [Saprospiraceae bacterium]|nr:hypothetical protein [Saprospiraceae bacterium]
MYLPLNKIHHYENEQNKNIPDPTLNKEEKRHLDIHLIQLIRISTSMQKKRRPLSLTTFQKQKPQTRVQVLVQEMKRILMMTCQVEIWMSQALSWMMRRRR